MLDGEVAHSSYSWKHDPLFWAYSILMFLPIITVFAFCNYYHLDFLVYAGWILLVFSIVIILLAGGEFRKKGGVPKGKSVVHTTVLVDSGVYAVVRHPRALHKRLQSTEVYINLEQAVFTEENDEFYVKAVKTLDEACKLIEVGFEYVTDMEGCKIFRKRK